MTNKEAIELLKTFRFMGDAKKAFDLAISALEQQPEPEPDLRGYSQVLVARLDARSIGKPKQCNRRNAKDN